MVAVIAFVLGWLCYVVGAIVLAAVLIVTAIVALEWALDTLRRARWLQRVRRVRVCLTREATP